MKRTILAVLVALSFSASPVSAEVLVNPHDPHNYFVCDYYSGTYWCWSNYGEVWFRAIPGFKWGG